MKTSKTKAPKKSSHATTQTVQLSLPVEQTTLVPTKIVHQPMPTVGEVIWSKIKDRTVNLFGFNKKLSDHCTFVAMDPNKCFLAYNPSSAITAIEQAAPEYHLEQMGKYAVLTVK